MGADSSADHLPRGSADLEGYLPRVMEIAERISQFRGLDDVSRELFDTLRECFQVKEMFLALYDEMTSLFVVRSQMGFPPGDAERVLALCFPPEQIRLQAQDRFRVGRHSYYVRAEEWSHFNRNDPFYDHPELLTRPRELPDDWHEVDFFVFHLVDRHGRLNGFLEVDDSLSGKLPSIETVRAIETVSSLAGIAVEGQRMYEAMLSERQFSEMLMELMTHDIRDMCQTITDRCGKLIDAPPRSREVVSAAAGSIREESEKIGQVISQVDRMAGARSKRSDSGMMCVDMATAIHRSMIDILRQFPGAPVRFSFEPPSERCLANADDLIEEVFCNLFSNSVKFGPKERIEIGISIRPERRDNRDFWLISVSDNGAGIPEHDRGRVFEKYHRSADGLKPGLGLFISKTLMAGYGGSIWCEGSDEGKGATGTVFKVLVPKFSQCGGRAY